VRNGSFRKKITENKWNQSESQGIFSQADGFAEKTAVEDPIFHADRVFAGFYA
jgi:hypothetical protein